MKEFWKMADQAYFGNEKSLSSIFHSQILPVGQGIIQRQFLKEIEE
jgi:hypothetical protein